MTALSVATAGIRFCIDSLFLAYGYVQLRFWSAMGRAALIGNHPIRQLNRALYEVVLRITEQDASRTGFGRAQANKSTCSNRACDCYLYFCPLAVTAAFPCDSVGSSIYQGVVHFMQPVRLGDTWMSYARPLRDIDGHELPITAATV